MENRLIVAGFGGQGVMMIGQLLCYAAIDSGKEALFLPHYGPEQRGGTANCTVTISSEPIGSPLVKAIDALIAMNDPSLVKFENRVKENGLIMMNSSMCKKSVTRTDVEVCAVPVDEIAEKIGSKKVANIVMLSAYAQKAGIFTEEELMKSVLGKLGKKVQYIEMNKLAVHRGMNLTKMLNKVYM
ncbi:2-oxoacid:acceptor oxidoreductase family protein [Tepidanaerobacter acetatoxydans]|uniref:2-oxoacid:acceptor oxidoreductase family protein n=1 Tax=Tepidanaerobacter acetatoxydans TaxID=499229 RepID=UPI001BD1F494|nr:2-oxoacid:acceptor oxidoreductase family protein [Tepidanaerobacter acetatoxydans]